MRLPEDQPPIGIGPDWDLELGTLDADVRAAAHLLRRSAIRYQPSFRFQEGLASRLRGADRADPSTAGMASITLLPVVAPIPPVAVGAGEAHTAANHQGWNRSLLVGGAIASGVSLAGAIMAWRLGRTRPQASGLAAGAQAIVRSIGERT